MTEKIDAQQYTFTAIKPDHSVTFRRPPNNEQIGRLDFNGEKMTFEGDADESAKIFFDYLAGWFHKRLEEERDKEREACAKVCGQYAAAAFIDYPDDRSLSVAGNECAAAILARGK